MEREKRERKRERSIELPIDPSRVAAPPDLFFFILNLSLNPLPPKTKRIPKQSMYLLVITNKSSNILEDLDTLRLLAKLVPDYAHPIDDDGVAAAAFDLLFAFDEAVSLGHREAVTPAQVRAACEMESHEERLHKMVIESKVADTRDLMKRKAAEIERAKLEQRVGGGSQSGGGQGMMPPTPQMGGGGGSGSYGGGGLGGGFGGGGGGGGFAAAPDVGGFGGGQQQPAPAASSRGGAAAAGGAGRGPKKGLRLGAAAAAASVADAGGGGGGAGGAPAGARGGGGGSRLAVSLRAEGEEIAEEAPTSAADGGGAASSSHAHRARDDASSFPAPASGEPLTVALDERVSASLSRDGGLEAPLEVQGTLSLAVHDEAAARVVLSVDTSTSDSSDSTLQWQFKTHPNIDKAAYASSGQLRLKDAGRPFPRGTPLGVLKWRAQSSDESALPVTINCWPSVSGAETFVNIEYECGPSASRFDLRDLTVSIPAPGPPASVPSLDGEWRYDARGRALLWTIELVDDANRSGSAEFVFPAAQAPPGSFFPVDVSFRVEGATMCPLKVVGVEAVDDGAAVKHGLRASLVADGYQVV